MACLLSSALSVSRPVGSGAQYSRGGAAAQVTRQRGRTRLRHPMRMPRDEAAQRTGERTRSKGNAVSTPCGALGARAAVDRGGQAFCLLLTWRCAT